MNLFLVARLSVAGRMLGIGFQLIDDLQGVFGDPAQTGKSATSDLRTRKQTPLLTVARSTPEWEQIRGYVGRELTEVELAEARRLLTSSGSRRFVEELIDAHLETARGLVEQLGIPWKQVAGVTTLDSVPADTDEVAA